MTNEQILKKAIEKAEENGLDILELGNNTGFDIECLQASLSLDCQVSWHLYHFIFSHSFAKAFWGNYYVCSNCLRRLEEEGCYKFSNGRQHVFTTISWKGHLQQMVLEPQPLKYLEKFFGKENLL